jgi:ATP-binding cassette, subfamily C, bacterial exporter for protease/lipase
MSANDVKGELRGAFEDLRPYFAWSFVFTVIGSLLSLAPVGYMKDVYGPVINSRSYLVLLSVTLLLVWFLVLSGVLDWLRFRMLSVAARRFNDVMGRRVFDAAYENHLRTRNSAAQMVLTDLKVIRSFFTSPAASAVFDAPVAILFLIMVYQIHPRMGVVSFGAAVVMAGVAFWTERRVRPLVSEAQKAGAVAQIYIANSVGNAQTIFSMGMLNSLSVRWAQFQAKNIRTMASATEDQSLGSALSKLIMVMQGSVVLGYGCYLTLMGEMPPDGGGMMIASILGGRAVQPIVRLISSWKNITAVLNSFERLGAFLAENPAKKETMELPPPTGLLEVEALSARAPGSRRVVVNNIAFALKPGMSMGVMGPSGSGKSSLARVLVGVWAPDAGSVRLDKADVHAWDKTRLGPYVGYLPQDVELLEGTVAENIARFGEVDMSVVQQAASRVGLHDYILALPGGYDAVIEEGSHMFSGGQRQRLGLARAIYGSPRLVVLDEPNSSLDPDGEALLYATIEVLKTSGSVVVVVTHRKGVVPYMDRLLIMKNGKPMVAGPRDLVLDKLAGKDVKTVTAAPSSKKLDGA